MNGAKNASLGPEGCLPGNSPCEVPAHPIAFHVARSNRAASSDKAGPLRVGFTGFPSRLGGPPPVSRPFSLLPARPRPLYPLNFT
jgi:hypothetical protein